jgi:transposase
MAARNARDGRAGLTDRDGGVRRAHYWARKLSSLGHEVKQMAPQLVKPYVKSNKNDRNDAEAICEALGRPNMRFVPIKNPE